MYAGDVRVRTTDGTTYPFRGVGVSADSLGGWLTEPGGTERAFPLSDVATVQVWHQGSAPSHEGPGLSSEEESHTVKVIGVVALVALVGFAWYVNTMHN